MGCGTPVLTAQASSLPEVAGDAALLVEPTDIEAIAAGLWRLLSDEALRQQLLRRGQERIQRYTWAAAARELLAAYDQCHAMGGRRNAVG